MIDYKLVEKQFCFVMFFLSPHFPCIVLLFVINPTQYCDVIGAVSKNWLWKKYIYIMKKSTVASFSRSNTCNRVFSPMTPEFVYLRHFGTLFLLFIFALVSQNLKIVVFYSKLKTSVQLDGIWLVTGLWLFIKGIIVIL